MAGGAIGGGDRRRLELRDHIHIYLEKERGFVTHDYKRKAGLSPAGLLVEYVLDIRDRCVRDLEGRHIFKKNLISVAHLPTLMLAIGYPIYWAEMLSGGASTGVTSPAATVLFIIFAIFVLFREKASIRDALKEYGAWFQSLHPFDRLMCGAICALILGILFITGYASMLPIHLQQEGDALNYHYSLTRQHLILGSFAHIPWSGFDLFLLPVNFALAPYWFVTEFPNKIPQFIFFAGLILIMTGLVRHWQKKMTFSVLLALALLFGSHGHGIQFGSAMLDLINCYLFLAMIHSFIHRVHWLFIIEACFYFWAKPFMPLQTIFLILVFGLIVVITRKLGFKEIGWGFHDILDKDFFHQTRHFLKRCILGLILVFSAVGGPFVLKSLYYAGTPLFPFVPGMLKVHAIPDGSIAWNSVLAMSQYSMEFVRNTYGHGRSLWDFFAHFWLISVPSQGVNNAFDYPLGLSYLLALGPFVILLLKSVRERKIVIFPWLTLVFWTVWFMGSQQTRWLYAPVLIVFLSVSATIIRPSRILMGVLLVAVFLNFVSIFRAHSPDLKKTQQDIFREKDRALIELSRQYIASEQKGYVVLDDSEVAYAQFPVMIRKESIPNVIAF